MSRNLFSEVDDEQLKKNIGDRLTDVRNRLGKTQSEMAEDLHIAFRSLQDNERGKSIPGGKVLSGYVRMGVNVNWLLTGEGSALLGKHGDTQSLTISEPPKLMTTKNAQMIPIPLIDASFNRQGNASTTLLLSDSEAQEKAAMAFSPEVFLRTFHMKKLAADNQVLVAVRIVDTRFGRSNNNRLVVFANPGQKHPLSSGHWLIADEAGRLVAKTIIDHGGHFIVSPLGMQDVEVVLNKGEVLGLHCLGRIVGWLETTQILAPPRMSRNPNYNTHTIKPASMRKKYLGD
jgi:transcriptional regulator with XRE-family HTH domain